MSQENVEVVRRCMQLWPAREIERIPEFFDPEIVIDLRGRDRDADLPGLELREGRIVSVVGGYRDRATALEDAGLAE